MNVFKGRKTYILAGMYGIVAFVQYLQGEVDMDPWELIQHFVAAATVIAVRLGIAKGG